MRHTLPGVCANVASGAANIAAAGIASFTPASTPIQPSAALHFMRGRFGGPTFAPATPGLCAIIRAGLLENLADAVPRTIESERALKDSENIKVAAEGAGLSITHSGILKRKITSLDQIHAAFYNTLLPALIAQPQALLDWSQFISSIFWDSSIRSAWPRIGWLSR